MTCSRTVALESVPSIFKSVFKFSRAPIASAAILILLSLLIYSYPAFAVATWSANGAAPSLVQSNSGGYSSGKYSSASAQFWHPQNGGDLNVAIVSWSDTTAQIVSVIDSAGNAYALAVQTINSSGLSQAVYYAKNIVPAPTFNTVTVTFSTTATAPGVRLLEYKGIDRNNPIDVAVGNQGYGSQSSGQITTTNTQDLLIASSWGDTLPVNDPSQIAPFTCRQVTYVSQIYCAPGVMDLVTLTSGQFSAAAPLQSPGNWLMNLVAFRVDRTVNPHYMQSNWVAAGASQTTVDVPYLQLQGAGDLNVIVVGWRDATAQISTVSDTAGNTYVLAVGPTVNPGGVSQAIYYAKNIVASPPNNVVHVTFTAAASSPNVRIAEYSGLDTQNPIANVAVAQGTPSGGDSQTITTTVAPTLVIGANTSADDTIGWSAGTLNDNALALRALTPSKSTMLGDLLVSTPSQVTPTINMTASYWVVQLVALRVANQPPVVNAGPKQSITLPTSTASLQGTATDDGLPNGTLTINWSVVSGPGTVTFSNPNAAQTNATFSAAGTYVLQLTANDSQLSSSSTVTINVYPAVAASASLTLSPTMAGPNVTGTAQSLIATLKDATGNPVSGYAVQFTVTGVNAVTGSATTDVNGAATFSYTGAHAGADTVQATIWNLSSNTSTVNWIATTQNVSTGPVLGTFFASDQSGVFNTPPTATPVFTQTFPTINFNPPSGTLTQQYSIDGRTVPWRTTSTINTNYYVSGINTTGLNPVSVPVTPGETVSVAYVSGLWCVSNPVGTVYGAGCNGYGSWDANGQQPFATGSNIALPGADAQSLVGGFADANGQILSPGPFFIGNSFSATVPTQTTQLFMGMNDGTTWSDNSGALLMNVTTGNAPNPAGVGISTHPFTDVVSDPNGNYTGTIIAQGEGVQVGGVGSSLYAFNAVFRGTLTVANAGDVSLYIYANDGFILGIGNGVSRVSGPMVNAPGSTAFESLPVMGAYNQPEEQTNTIVVHFPAAGTYPYELDYAENGGGGQNPDPPNNHLSLVMSVGVNINGQNITKTLPPTAALGLTPLAPPSLNTGESQTFSAKAVDASGSPVPNLQVTFVVIGANAQQSTSTTDVNGVAQFSYSAVNAGRDIVTANTSISGLGILSNSVNVTWGIPAGAPPGTVIVLEQQGWIAQPKSGTVVTGQALVTVASGETLTSGTLKFWPSSNPSAVTILNSNTTGSGTIGTFDATTLASGGYTMQLAGTDSTGATQTSVIVLSVVGANKPGRMTSTVTEFKVPLAGIPISITRTYDSLEKNLNEDFGYGWKLGTTVNLAVDSRQNVTFNFNGQRKTFYFQPQPSSFWFAWLQVPQYTPEPGTHGTLISDGCSGLLKVQNTWQCFGGGVYQPALYAYTDPVGRTYTISGSGQLLSTKDLNGNTLTVTPNGIISSTGSTVIPFSRDGQGRITQISDLNTPPNVYTYTYDTNGNLASVQYPGLTAAETYAYFPDHSLQTETDPRGNASSATYYSDGRLQSVTGPTVQDINGNPIRYTTQYAYDLSTNKTMITNPDGGVVSRIDDAFGKPLSLTEQVDATTSRTTTYQYDPTNENLTMVTDPLGHWTKYTYDGNGFQTSVQLQGLSPNSITYNQFGGVASQTDAANTNTITITPDSNFNPSQVTDLLNGAGTFVASFTYDSVGNMLTSKDANQKSTTYTYYTSGANIGYVKDKTDALQEKTKYTYDPMGSVATVTDPRNYVTQYFYDGLERLTKVIDASNFTKQTAYDNNGNKTDETDAVNTTLQRNTHYDYDALNRLTKITYPDTTTKQFFYDFRGNKTKEVDQLGRATVHTYDLAGQLKTVTYASGTSDAGIVSYAYYLDGRQQTVTDERGNVTTNFYDPAGRLTSVQDPLHNSTLYGYDNDNRRTSVTDANNHTTGYAYDPRSRLKTITYPTSPATTTQYTYDGMGRMLTTTDQDVKITTKTYDDVGRLGSVKDAVLPNGNTTYYTYDASGNLKTIEDALQRYTLFDYDNLNRRTKRTLPLLQFETYNYDALGRLQTKTDFNGKTTTYNYDSLDRILSRVPDSSLGQQTISFTYFGTGTRHTMSDASGSTTYTYDSRDRLLTKATPEGTLTYTYDAHGNVLTITSSNTNGASMTYAYDQLNRLWTAKDNRIAAQGGPSTAATYSHDAAGNLSGYTYPNTLVTSTIFDNQNRLIQICTATTSPACSAGTKQSSYTYTVGNAGNRTNVLELGGRNVAYGYDEDYRLKSEAISVDPSSNNGTVNYVYDPVGNRASMTSTLAAVPGGQFFYDNNDRLTTDVYDNNGNTTSSAGIANTYDFENRMKSHGAVAIVYDGDGNRVSETAGGTTTKYLVDDLNPTRLAQVLDEVVSNSVTRTYAYGLQRISENQKIKNKWTPSYYGYDGHGNVRFVTNTTGAVTDSYDYDAFGMPVKTSGTTPNIFLYSGEWLDSSVGLYHLRARYYNQANGRFWARDPVEGAKCCGMSWNPYVYVRDNPVNATDPMGREALMDKVQVDWKVSLAQSVALTGLALEIICADEMEGSGVGAVASNIGNLQGIEKRPSICRIFASRTPNPPNIPPYGPYPAPFFPSLDWATQPGNPWNCETNAEGRITFCSKRCPNGGEEWFTWDPGTKYGEAPHWDWHRCDNSTCKIYIDGTSTCPPE